MLHKLLQGDALQRTTVEHLVLHSPEKPFTGWIAWQKSFPRHGPGEPCILNSLDPAGPSVMAAPIRMNNRMLLGCKVAKALSSILLTNCVFGLVLIIQLCSTPLKQPMTVGGYILPDERVNSFKLVSQFWFGSAAWKFHCGILGTSGLISYRNCIFYV